MAIWVSYLGLKVVPPSKLRIDPTSCPGGVSRPRSYQSVAVYSDSAPAQVGFPALEVTKVSLFIVIPLFCLGSTLVSFCNHIKINITSLRILFSGLGSRKVWVGFFAVACGLMLPSRVVNKQSFWGNIELGIFVLPYWKWR